MAAKKRDTSPVVHQRDKVESTFKVKALNWTSKQKEFIDTALDKETKIMFLNGPAGTGKSLLAVYCALRMLTERKISDIIYIRSAVESSDSKLGYLPGDADQKLQFYNLPFVEKMQELLSPKDAKKLEADERVSMYPVNYARGMSWNAKCIIFDEVQNSSRKEIITVLTRLGMFCKCFVLADPMQTDLPPLKGGAIEKIHKLFSDEESAAQGIKAFEFDEDDIMRSELVKYLVKRFKDLK
jgi:phosphate starvation-inducible PhoH-like protein